MSFNPRFYDECAVKVDGWVRAFPVGTFKRKDWVTGELRTLEITSPKLAQMAANFKAGFLGYKPPINLEHDKTAGRVGTIADVEARPDGLYILPDEEALPVLRSGKFGYVSPEVVWSGYANNQGDEAENVLTGLGLTNQPFFGEQTALFSVGDLVHPDSYRDYTVDERKAMAEKGQALPDGSFPIADKEDLHNAIQAAGRASDNLLARRHIIKRARALNCVDMLPSGWIGATDHAALPLDIVLGLYGEALRFSGQETLAPAAARLFSTLVGGQMPPEVTPDTQAQTPAPAPVPAPAAEAFDAAATVEQYRAQAEAASAKATALEAQMRAMSDQFSAVVRDLEAQKRAGRVRGAQDWIAENMGNIALENRDAFAALLVEAEDKLGQEHLTALRAVLAGANQAIGTGELFSRVGSAQVPASGADEFSALVMKHQQANPSMKYEDAVALVAAQNPALYVKVAGGRK